MVRPTKELQSIPFRTNGIFGWDPGTVAPDPSDPPVDRVIDGVPEMPTEVTTAKVQEAEDSETSPASVSVTLPAPPTEGNLLVGVYWARGDGVVVAAPSGWDMLGPADSTSFDGGTTAILYKFAGPAESDTLTVAVAAISHLWFGEFSGVAGLAASDLDDAVAAATNLTTDSLVTPETHLVLIASFVQAARAASYTWGSGFTELDDHQLDASGPAGTAGWKDVAASDGTEVATVTSTESDGYGWILAAFYGTDRTWVLAPETQDEDDATYRAVDITGSFWRIMLEEAVAIGTARAFIGFDSSSSRTVTLEGATSADFADAVALDAVTLTSTGSYTGDEFAFTIDSPAPYQFYRLVGSGAYDMRVYTVELYDYDPADATAVQAALDEHVADPTDAHDAAAVSYDNGSSGLTADDVQEAIDELAALVSASDLEAIVTGVEDHGNLGSTEAIDAEAAGYHAGVLDDDCTFTFTGATADVLAQFLLELTEDGTGGHAPIWPGSVTWLGDTPTHDETAGATTIYGFFSRDGGATWLGYQAGASGGSAITVEDEGTPLATAAETLDFVGAGVTASGTGAEKTITIPGVTADAVRDAGVWVRVTVPGSASPPDDVYSPDGTEWVYAWVPA